MRFYLAILGCLLGALTATAELRFDRDVVEVAAETGKTKVKATFEFQNVGDQSIRVQKIDTSCGCLRANANRKTYNPGQEGNIDAEFNVGGNTGTVEKSITVHTDAGEPIKLKVRIKVAELLSIEPKMATWSLNETGTKKIEFKVLRDEPIHITGLSPSRKNVTATLQTIEEGRHYIIEIAAADTSDTMLGVVRIDTDCEIREQKKQMAFFRISKEETTTSGNAE